MSKANRLGVYADVRQVLDAALVAGGGKLECPSHGSAVHWRQRAYRFRKLYAETLGPKAMSEYDVLVLPRLAPDSATVTILVRQPVGIFTPTNEVGLAPTTNDDLLEAAEELRRKLGVAK